MRDGVQMLLRRLSAVLRSRWSLRNRRSATIRDNAERFALFCRAVLEATKVPWRPDILHCHDWQTALIPILLNTLYSEDPVFERVPCVFTIHNLGYQGLFQPEILPLLLLPWDLFTMTKLEFYGKVNFLKGAITSADFITTVSRKYAQEIQTSEYGFGLEGVLRARSGTVAGILNGVDYGEWNPETDPHIAANYSAERPERQSRVQADLLKEFGLPEDTQLPVIGHRVALCRTEGLRPDSASIRPHGARGIDRGRPRHRRPRLRRHVPPA